MPAARAGRGAGSPRAPVRRTPGPETLLPEARVPTAAIGESREGGRPFSIDLPRLDRVIEEPKR